MRARRARASPDCIVAYLLNCLVYDVGYPMNFTSLLISTYPCTRGQRGSGLVRLLMWDGCLECFVLAGGVFRGNDQRGVQRL